MSCEKKKYAKKDLMASISILCNFVFCNTSFNVTNHSIINKNTSNITFGCYTYFTRTHAQKFKKPRGFF